ncbi:uncharacterized protein LOC135836931 [Planococcus citri]|uniref:uncharacterized protein LOC135836931 n=1 Tax=Planococcus citri TaxID=170843 RepID=UPI0031F7F22D
MKFLVERFSYDAEWQDEDEQFLIQRIFQERAFKVLKSCLELNIIESGPFKDQFSDDESLLLYVALKYRAPEEVIKLLIERTDAGTKNVFFRDEYKLAGINIMLRELLSYVKPMEIIEHALRKGIDFSFCLSDVLDKFKIKNVCNPLLLVRTPPFDHSDFIDRCSSYTSKNYNYLYNLFPFIEQLLKAGIGYSYIDARLGHELHDPRSYSTYRIVQRLNDMHKLLYKIYNIHKQNDKENDDPRQILFGLIFNYIRSLGIEAVEITINPKELRIYPHYQEECDCEDKIYIRDLISWVIRYSMYMKYLESDVKLNNTQNYTICIWPVPEKGTILSDTREDPFPKFKSVMMELFFEYYILRADDNYNLVKCAVDELRKRVPLLLANSSALLIPIDFFSFVGYVREVYNKTEILENVNEKNEHRKESLNKLVKSLLSDVLLLHFHQNYKIIDALNEISEEVIKLEEVFSKLLEIGKQSSGEHNIILNEDQVLDILGLKNITSSEREDLQKLVSEICDDTTGFHDLVEIWSLLDSIGQRNAIPVLEHMLKFSEQLKQIFDLFKELHEGYENLICAVKEDDVFEVWIVLQTVKQDFVKAIIHGQDEDYGSPLHYAALNGQAYIINIFLDHGANPNLRLCNNFEKITHFSQAAEKMKKDHLSEDFVNWTPLYFAVLNGHLEVVQSLIERGADVNHVLYPGRSGYSPLHISALSGGSLKIAQLLLKNGARFNVPNGKGKTPLDLATFGSDVGNLLCFVNGLFRIVEEGERNAVISVFEVLDFDSWEAVLNAQNIDSKTLFKLTEINARNDIFELLSEKFRLVESRVLQNTARRRAALPPESNKARRRRQSFFQLLTCIVGNRRDESRATIFRWLSDRIGTDSPLGYLVLALLRLKKHRFSSFQN